MRSLVYVCTDPYNSILCFSIRFTGMLEQGTRSGNQFSNTSCHFEPRTINSDLWLVSFRAYALCEAFKLADYISPPICAY